MQIRSSVFTGSFTRLDDCPEAIRPEYAFIGRSNVGKSSLINMLTGKTQLAKTSQTPGKTQLINYFLINHEKGQHGSGWYLVDLPGYGYAKASKTSRQKWEKMIRRYLAMRKSLQCVFVLIDSRIPPQALDLEFVNWLGEMGVPFILLFTKADKQTHKKTLAQTEAFLKAMQESWDALPQHIITSAQTKQGREEVLALIADVNSRFEPVIDQKI